MNLSRWSLSVSLLVLAIAGCGAPLHRALVPETRPEVRLSFSRLAAPSPGAYAVMMSWAGISPARPVSHYLWAVDPPSVDGVDGSWTRTTDTQRMLSFPNEEEGGAHVFAVVAVDERGEMSQAKAIAFTADNQPPVVTITQPVPNSAFDAATPAALGITWSGFDPDGQTTSQPVQYTYRMFGKANPDFPGIPDFIAFARLRPDSLRKLYAPGFPGWTSVSGTTTSAAFRMTVGQQYLFAITAFDEAGDYDPIFSTSRNMLFGTTVAYGTAGPLLRMFNQFFDYTYPNGGWLNDPVRYFHIEIPSDQPVTINWDGIPGPGKDIRWFRWVLDPVDLFDETPRTDEMTDVHHWSARSPIVKSATIGPLTPLPRRPHLFYIETEDNVGLRSLGIVAINVYSAGPMKDLLIVDDTRMAPDQRSSPGGPIGGPVGVWPMAAELDSFLFARGGHPWQARAPGTLSTPGIFNGYDYDTVGTRSLLGDVTLSVLSSYRHVVWYTDPNGATYTSPPTDPVTPITALRLMSSPGRMSSIAAFVSHGGKVWLLGGGAANASLVPYNNINNGPSTYSRELGELREGRLMFDLAHWREEIQLLPATRANKFAPGAPVPGQGDNRPGRGWPPNPVPPTPPSPPDYSILPLALAPKNGATDPLPPGREFDPGAFYVGNYTAEYISQPSFVFEDYDDGPNEQLYSTLDTLYLTRGGSAVRDRPVMTYYHGRDNEPFVFSGFNIWYWRRPDCIALVDFVLGSVWGLPRDPGAPRSATGPAAARRAAP